MAARSSWIPWPDGYCRCCGCYCRFIAVVVTALVVVVLAALVVIVVAIAVVIVAVVVAVHGPFKERRRGRGEKCPTAVPGRDSKRETSSGRSSQILAFRSGRVWVSVMSPRRVDAQTLK